MEIQWNANTGERNLIRQITARAWKHDEVRARYNDALDLDMDIEATHCNGNPLRLQDMLEAKDFDFFHDIFGICRHLNRTTGQLTGHFCPRFSQRQTEAA